MREILIKEHYDFREDVKFPTKKFAYSSLILRSINDTTYPEMVDDNSQSISPWFKVEPYDFYHNGIGIILSIRYAVFDDKDEWDLAEYGREIPNGVPRSKVFEVGQIPYENIVAYDDQGDEYYPQPHLYCDFRNNGMPYEGFACFVICDEENGDDCYPVQLESKKRKVGLQLKLSHPKLSKKQKATPQ